tara:strand:+ start:8769 stop:8960 length:192 start_codon:yes stop_codon:yes gene_type:complete
MEKLTLVSSACTKLMKLIISEKNFSFRKLINAMTRVYMIDVQQSKNKRGIYKYDNVYFSTIID